MKLPPDLRASLTNTSNPNGYPIVGFSWLIVRANAPGAAQIKRFLEWVVTSGQSYTRPLSYASLPENLRSRETQMIASIN